MPVTLDKLRELRINQVRIFLSDFPHMNRLLTGEESDKDTIELAIDMSIDNFNNAEGYQTNFELSNFPSLKILIYGAVMTILQMKGMLYSRNRLNYSDAGVQVAINDKAPEYMQWATAMEKTYDRLVVNKKIALNVSAGWGGVSSEYGTVDFWY